jgi:hypothetical protein
MIMEVHFDFIVQRMPGSCAESIWAQDLVRHLEWALDAVFFVLAHADKRPVSVVLNFKKSCTYSSFPSSKSMLS